MLKITFKKISLLVILLLCMTAFFACAKKTEVNTQDNGSKFKIVASILPVYDFINKIGGERVEVDMLVPLGMDSHDFELTARNMNDIYAADMVFISGNDMEVWFDDFQPSKNNPPIISLDANLLMNPENSHSDPHVWLNPLNVEIEMRIIRDKLTEIDPEGKEYYNDNYNLYSKKLKELDEKFKASISPYENNSIVVVHNAFDYLCTSYKIEQIAIEKLGEESDPSPARMQEIIDIIKEKKIGTVFYAPLSSDKVAKTIANEAGITVDTLDPYETISKEQMDSGIDYFSVMEENLSALVRSFEKTENN